MEEPYAYPATYNPPPQAGYNPRLPSINYPHQLPSAPISGNLYQALPPIGSNRVAPMAVAQPTSYVVPTTTRSTSSSKLSPCAITAIVVVTLLVLTGIGVGIALGVIFSVPDIACYSWEFECTSGSSIVYSGNCISSSYRCDGTNQCYNGEDEADCVNTCSSSEFYCESGGPFLYGGSCISNSYRCDVLVIVMEAKMKRTVKIPHVLPISSRALMVDLMGIVSRPVGNAITLTIATATQTNKIVDQLITRYVRITSFTALLGRHFGMEELVYRVLIDVTDTLIATTAKMRTIALPYNNVNSETLMSGRSSSQFTYCIYIV